MGLFKQSNIHEIGVSKEGKKEDRRDKKKYLMK